LAVLAMPAGLAAQNNPDSPATRFGILLKS
jgi:hypothetical protein